MLTGGQKALLFLVGVLIVEALLGFGLFSVLQKDKKNVQAVAAGDKPMTLIRQQLLKAGQDVQKPRIIVVNKKGSIFVVANPIYPGGNVMYWASPGYEGNMDERLFSEQISRVVTEKDDEYKDLAVRFINGRTAQ